MSIRDHYGMGRISAAIIVLVTVPIASALAASFIYAPSSSSTSSSYQTSSFFSATSTSSLNEGSSTSTFTSSSTSSFSSSFTTRSSSSITTATRTTSTNSTSPFAGDWLTYHYNNARDANYASVMTITSAVLTWNSTVDGWVYAEPLYYNELVYVATENNTVYALNGTSGKIVWSNHLGQPMSSTTAPLQCDNNSFHEPDIQPTIGITGTPVIDPISGTIYVAALVDNTGFELYALSTGTGHVDWHSSITAPGFKYLGEEERGALALANGLVYVSFGGYSWDCLGPTGWIIAMSASGRGEQYSFQVPTLIEGDMWDPEGPSVDSSGFVYAVTGDSNNATFDYGDSALKFTSNLTLVSYFAAANWQFTNENDIDLGSTGATLLPGNLAFAIGKDGVGFLLNSSSLGGIGGELYNATTCGPSGAWGSTSYANGIIYVPCGASCAIGVPCSTGLVALALHQGPNPSFSRLWNFSGFFAGPPIVAYGAVWTIDIYNGTMYALNETTGAVISRFLIPYVAIEHFATPAAGGGLIFFASVSTIYALDPSP